MTCSGRCWIAQNSLFWHLWQCSNAKASRCLTRSERSWGCVQQLDPCDVVNLMPRRCKELQVCRTRKPVITGDSSLSMPYKYHIQGTFQSAGLVDEILDAEHNKFRIILRLVCLMFNCAANCYAVWLTYAAEAQVSWWDKGVPHQLKLEWASPLRSFADSGFTDQGPKHFRPLNALLFVQYVHEVTSGQTRRGGHLDNISCSKYAGWSGPPQQKPRSRKPFSCNSQSESRNRFALRQKGDRSLSLLEGSIKNCRATSHVKKSETNIRNWNKRLCKI